jgi:M6 family metalloprotease-like protein
MKKILISLTLLFSMISIPAHADSCTRPFLRDVADQTKKTGTINVQIIFIKFNESPKKSKSWIKDWVGSSNFIEMNNYIKETSYGKAKLKFTVNNKWINIPNESWKYDIYTEQTENAFRDDIIKFADPVVDFSKTDVIWAVTDRDVKGSGGMAFRNAVVVDGKKMVMFWYTEFDPYLAVSEVLHGLGLRDLYSTVSIFGPDGGMTQFSIMGQYNGGTNLLGYEKYALGWLSAKDYVCQESGSKTYKLSSLDSKGMKLILVPINAQEMLAIEYRKKEKRDRYLGSSGILVYHINNSLFNTDKGSPINPIYFGNKKNLTFQGINIDIKKTSVTVSK